MMLTVKAHQEMCSSRPVAFSKSGGGVRPIAVGDCLFRILSMLDGASVASLTPELFLLSNQNHFILKLDFKNAFNSVRRSAIFDALFNSFPHLVPFFYRSYGSSASIAFNEHTLFSSSGVRQGDALGPFLFCLTIHPVLVTLQSLFPNIKIIAYMDDISLIGTINDLGAAAAFAFQEFNKIGLSLNTKNCLMIGHTSCNFLIDSQLLTFVNYSSEAFRFLGCFLTNKTNKTSIAALLTQKLESINSALDEIAQIDIQNHLKFFILKICYS
ncbi:hypothetical protein RCL1_002057 [Eukaryota sp. TZLM3-RCL]